ncbi:MAG: YqgE/AlgH family protein [Pirellulaceae bacterium]|nr:YqgE/AlgH family protein [Pirellulaceae bacterium]
MLISSPHMNDDNFARTVVLLLQHDAHGAMGVVINRLSERNIDSLWRDIFSKEIQEVPPLYLGGPVQGPPIALHDDSSSDVTGSVEVVPGVYVATNLEQLQQIVLENEASVRIYLGCASWAEGQLEAEISYGGWYVAPATHEVVFYHEDSIWRRVVQLVGDQLLSHVIGKDENQKDFDPSLN